MQSLDQFLTGLEKNPDTKDILEGKASYGGFDGPPLATTRQYHGVVSRGEWRQSQAGKWQFAFTFEILGDDEWTGRKFTEYYSKDGDNRINDEKFARFIGESGLDLKVVDRSSEEAFAKSFEGVEYILATRIWGTDGDRTGLRYLNRYTGQEPLLSIAPPKPQKDSKNLRADIQVNKERGPGQPEQGSETDGETAEVSGDEQDTAPQTPSVALPGSGRAPGVNLPPGLR